MSVVDRFVVNDRVINEPNEISNKFCDVFGNIGKDIQGQIPNTNKHWIDFFKDRESKSMFLTPTTVMEVKDILCSLKSKKSIGHDRIRNEILKITPVAVLL